MDFSLLDFVFQVSSYLRVLSLHFLHISILKKSQIQNFLRQFGNYLQSSLQIFKTRIHYAWDSLTLGDLACAFATLHNILTDKCVFREFLEETRPLDYYSMYDHHIHTLQMDVQCTQ